MLFETSSNHQAVACLYETLVQRAKRTKQLETGSHTPFILVMFIYPVTGAAPFFTCSLTSCVILEEMIQENLQSLVSSDNVVV